MCVTRRVFDNMCVHAKPNNLFFICFCLQDYAKLLVPIMHKNPTGLRCHATMVSYLNETQLGHVFILMTKLFSTLGKPEEPNGMFECKAIFATSAIKNHKDITEKMWQNTRQVFMFFQPSINAVNGLIKSHVTIGDVQENDTCWSQTCTIERCVAKVKTFIGINRPQKRTANGVGGAANANSRGSQVQNEEEGGEEEEDEEEEEKVKEQEVQTWCNVDSDDEVDVPQTSSSSTDPQHFASVGQKRQGSPVASRNGGVSEKNNGGKRRAIDTESDAVRPYAGLPPHSLFLNTKTFTASEAAYGSKSLGLSTSTVFGRVVAFIHSSNGIVCVLCRIFDLHVRSTPELRVFYILEHTCTYIRYLVSNLLVIWIVRTYVPAQRHFCVLCC